MSSKEDKINIDPGKWGPYAWPFLFSIICGYPINPSNERKEHMRQYFHKLANVLPCDKCIYNFEIDLQKYPLTEEVLSSRNNLMIWFANINNEINRSTNKKTYTPEEFFNYYNSKLNYKETCKKTIIKGILLIGFLFFAIYIIRNYYLLYR